MLSVGQNILVSKKNDGKWHSSVVMDVDTSEVIISQPKLNGEQIVVEAGDTLEISFSQNGARYHFESGFSEKIGDVLVVKRPRLLEKIDFRRYPRVPVDMEVSFSEISARESVRHHKRKGRIMDISGNGLRFSADQLYIPSTYINIKFDLPLDEKSVAINADCRVVRIIVNDRTDPVEYQLGAEFSRIVKRDQEFIIDYVCKKIKGDDK
jgi:c-di-GMP-binding flagellar brake protein YcgR